MPHFTRQFIVNAPLQAVAAFHRDARTLQQLTPPPMWAQMHRVEPLAEDSVAEFTLWLGPLPIRWLAVHSQVQAQHGFVDTQAQGPMQQWVHTHTFTALGPTRTQVQDHIEFEHFPGWRGWWTRVLFAPFNLWFLFFYRACMTQWGVKRTADQPRRTDL